MPERRPESFPRPAEEPPVSGDDHTALSPASEFDRKGGLHDAERLGTDDTVSVPFPESGIREITERKSGVSENGAVGSEDDVAASRRAPEAVEGVIDFAERTLNFAAAKALIAAGEGRKAAEGIGRFSMDERRALLAEMLRAGDRAAADAALERTEGLSMDDAKALFAAGLSAETFLDRLSSFDGIPQLAVARTLIAAGHGDVVAERMDRFETGARAGIADALIDSGDAWHVVMRLSQLGLDETETARILARIDDIGTR